MRQETENKIRKLLTECENALRLAKDMLEKENQTDSLTYKETISALSLREQIIEDLTGNKEKKSKYKQLNINY